jgi:hypothetical protein
MAILHRAELQPTKLELLAGWLPTRRWYHGPATPQLVRVAGFRFDDPAGEVGLETLLVRADDRTIYHVPLSYRGEPLPGRDDWLVGTSEHSVLGRRWIYDASGDPVYAGVLAGAILAGTGQAEELVEMDGRLERREPSMSVASTAATPGAAPVIEALRSVLDNDDVTSIVTEPVILTVVRGLVLTVPPPSAAIPALTGTWSGQPDQAVLALAFRR